MSGNLDNFRHLSPAWAKLRLGKGWSLKSSDQIILAQAAQADPQVECCKYVCKVTLQIEDISIGKGA